MSKEAFYFQHDYEAVNDPKIIALLYEFGAVGYGIWWRIVEMLHSEDDHCIKKKPYILTAIASQLKVEVDQVKQVLEYACEVCELLEQDEECYWSARVMRNLEKREELKKKKREAGRKGGKSKSTTTDQPKEDAQLDKDTDADSEQTDELSESKHIQADAKQTEAGAKHVLNSAKQKQAKERKEKERKEKEINKALSYAHARGAPDEEMIHENTRDGPIPTPSEQEWMDYCTLHGFKPEFAKHVFEHQESVGWQDPQGRPIKRWQAFANSRYRYQEGYMARIEAKNKSNTNKNRESYADRDARIKRETKEGILNGTIGI